MSSGKKEEVIVTCVQTAYQCRAHAKLAVEGGDRMARATSQAGVEQAVKKAALKLLRSGVAKLRAELLSDDKRSPRRTTWRVTR